MKRKPTDREILNAAIQQVEAMLLGSCAENGVGKGRGRPGRSAWRMRSQLKALVELADLLVGKIDEWATCEACGKTIRARQAYVHDSEDCLSFHTRCMDLPASKGSRMETPAYYRREMTRRAEEARAFLRKKGPIV